MMKQQMLYALYKKKPELITFYAGAAGFFARIFLINDKMNENFWRATWEAIMADGKDFVGKPCILTPEFDHTYSQTYDSAILTQEYYRNGDIIDVVFDEGSHTAYAIIKLKEEAWNQIQNGEIEYVSPAVWPRSKDDIKIVELTTPDGGGRHEHVVTRFLALHLAFVDDPAYGRGDAHIDQTCTGTHGECMTQLKRPMTASIDNDAHSFTTLAPIIVKSGGSDHPQYNYESVPDCVQKSLQSQLNAGTITEITRDTLEASYAACEHNHDKPPCGCDTVATKLSLMKADLDVSRLKHGF